MAPKTPDPYRASGKRVVHSDWADFCGHCGQKGGVEHRLRRCLGCNLIAYCDEKCRNSHWKAHRADCKAEQIQVKSSTPENARIYTAFKEWTRKHSIMLKMAGQYALIPSANTPEDRLLLESHVFRVRVAAKTEGEATSIQFEVAMAVAEPSEYLQALYTSRPEEYAKLLRQKKEVLEEMNPVTKEKEYAGVMFIVVECPCPSEPETRGFIEVVPAAIRPHIVESIKKKPFDGDFSLFLQAGIDPRSRVYADESGMLIVRNAPGTSKSTEATKVKRNRRAKRPSSSNPEVRTPE